MKTTAPGVCSTKSSNPPKIELSTIWLYPTISDYLSLSLSQVSCTCSTLFHHLHDLQMLFPLKASLIPLKPSFILGMSLDVHRMSDSTRCPSFVPGQSNRCWDPFVWTMWAGQSPLASPGGTRRWWILEIWRPLADMVHMWFIYC